MNLYIAYKFSKTQNKQALREEIQTVAIILGSKGHSTYILSRDLQNWQDFTHPMSHKMRVIFNEVKNSDAVFAFINSSVFSKGLLVELITAKILRKPVYMAVRKSIKPSFIEKFANKIFRYSNVNELETTNVASA